jgi:MarR family transcriptional regulator for hemolysin
LTQLDQDTKQSLLLWKLVDLSRPLEPDSIGFLVADISRLMRAELYRRTDEAGLGLTGGEARTLVHASCSGPVRQNVLAERMAVEAMTLSVYVDRLEGLGLVARCPDPADRRAKLVSVTPAADAILERIAPLAASVRAAASEGIAPADWDRLLEVLKRVRFNLLAVRSEAGGEKAA